MRLLAGTSGFSFPEWRGSFYPEDLANDGMLAYYAERLPAVEINQTFYRLPKRDQLEGWAAQVPETFSFVLKASRRITHVKRLRNADDSLAFLLESSRALKARLGALLFQLPPNAPENLERLEAFLAPLPADARYAFEFRHPSWASDETRALLASRNCALVLNDDELDEGAADELTHTADWTYLRLRGEAYTDDELARWLDRLRAAELERAFVFFKHEDGGAGARHAARMNELAG